MIIYTSCYKLSEFPFLNFIYFHTYRCRYRYIDYIDINIDDIDIDDRYRYKDDIDRLEKISPLF